MSPSSGLNDLIEDTISGKRQAIDWPWPELSDLTKALLPGTITMLCGKAGDSKSFLLLQAIAHWHDKGIKACVYELEDDHAFHLHRILAQREGNSDIADDRWMREHPIDGRAAMSNHVEWFDEFSHKIVASPDKQQTYNELLTWVEQQSKLGYRVIAIDPITAIKKSERVWTDDADFMSRIKVIARNYHNSIILVTHPSKSRGKAPKMEDLAGGADFERFCHTLIYIEAINGSKPTSLDTYDGQKVYGNRKIHLFKTRNGKGSGKKIVFNFSGVNLCFEELGIVKR